MRESSKKILSLILGPLFIALLISIRSDHRAAEAADAPYQGFGTTTPGGAGGTIVHVRNLNDSGPESLREALSAGDRTVVFDVSGEILLSDHIFVSGAFITIDGFTAPSPGITLKNRGLVIRGSKGAHDVIVRGIRVRDAAIDGIQISFDVYNIVIDHVSIAGSIDENIDITEGSHDVTVSWSILGGNGKNMLIKYNPSRVTLHHNIFVESMTRNPQVRIDDAGTPATDTTVDMRNNIVWDWGNGYGTIVWYGPWANVVNNLYSSPGSSNVDQKEAVVVCQESSPEGGCQDPLSFAQAYVDGNYSMDGLGMRINNQGNASIPFPAPAVDTEDPCAAANKALSEAGARPLDLVDQQHLSSISLSSCPGDLLITSLSAPNSAKQGSTVSVAYATKNNGPAPIGPSTTKLYFSANADYDPADVFLGSQSVLALDPGEISKGSSAATIPAGTAPGTYYIIAVADAESAVEEANESNNSRNRSIEIGPDLIISSLSAPSSAVVGSTISISDITKNHGVDGAGVSRTKFYLSKNKTFDSADVLLGGRDVPALNPGKYSSGSVSVTIPAGTSSGSYYIIGVADANKVVAECCEDNNTKYRSIDIIKN